jgi:hypothetical protein
MEKKNGQQRPNPDKLNEDNAEDIYDDGVWKEVSL